MGLVLIIDISRYLMLALIPSVFLFLFKRSVFYLLFCRCSDAMRGVAVPLAFSEAFLEHKVALLDRLRFPVGLFLLKVGIPSS